MRKKIVNFIAVVMLFSGFLILAKPYLRELHLERKNDKMIKEFTKKAEQSSPTENSPTGKNESNSDESRSNDESSSDESRNSDESNSDESRSNDEDKSNDESNSENLSFDKLYENMQAYNKKIFEENQSGLCDAFSYTTSSFDFSAYGITDDVAGYITIEKISVTMALYIGSNKTNMSKGATIMNQTSMPIGGADTNCVIAAHRSRGFLAQIEQLEPGDEIKITNLWQTLSYKVVKIIVIKPYDTDKIKIIPGQDIVTLLTCHPYGKNTNRYVVYCTRNRAGESDESDNTKEESDGSRIQNITAEELPDGIEYESSEKSIKNEDIIRICGMTLTGVFLIVYLWMFAAGRKK